MSAEPLSRREVHNVKVARVGPEDGQQSVVLLAADWDRIWSTLQDGLAPDPPTPYELDKWAARKIMQWDSCADVWVKHVDSLTGFQNVINIRDWKPSVDLGQALECAKATGARVPFELLASGAAVIGIGTSGGTTKYFEFDEYDETVIAELIVRMLHAEVGS